VEGYEERFQVCGVCLVPREGLDIEALLEKNG
jgi:hypothetical protein